MPVYGLDLEPDDRKSLSKNAAEIRLSLKRTKEDVLRIGQLLSESKDKLWHGRFGMWLATEIPELGIQSANQFIRVYKVYSGQDLSNVDMSIQSLASLAGAFVPSDLRAKVIEQANQGVKFSTGQVTELIRQAREKDNLIDASGMGQGDYKQHTPDGLISSLVRNLRLLNVEFEQDVECDSGVAKVVTKGAIYDIFEGGQISVLHAVTGRLLMMREEINPRLRALIIIRPGSLAIAHRNTLSAIGLSLDTAQDFGKILK